MKTSIKALLQKQIAIPQDHGSWVFILSPLLIGLSAGGEFTPGSAFLTLAALSVFFIRQPVTVIVKTWSGRRSRQELPAAWTWCLLYGMVALLAVAGLVLTGRAAVLLLAIPGIPIFLLHLYLVSKRAERRKPGIEILATGALSLVAPAASWAGSGNMDWSGWILWPLVWFQSAASIVYAYLRLEQRTLDRIPPRSVLCNMAGRSILYTSFNLFVALGLGLSGLLPAWLFTPYLVQWLETLHGSFIRPAIGFKPTRIGIRQLIVSSIFTVLFITAWR
ncbi:MAG: hypothetical protein FJZ96_15360 [Chloroflexi bacterium]|nr:hypothetical protein [Chloroflexota bacterium]